MGCCFCGGNRRNGRNSYMDDPPMRGFNQGIGFRDFDFDDFGRRRFFDFDDFGRRRFFDFDDFGRRRDFDFDRDDFRRR